MGRKLTPLVNPRKLRPDASLEGYIEELALANGYRLTNWLRGYIRGKSTYVRIPLGSSTKPEVYERLSEIAQVPIHRLYQASSHRFAEILTPPETDLQTFTLEGNLVPILG